MMDKKLRDEIVGLIKREVVPAVGCTEPVAVALCVARATETLGCLPEKIELFLSGNIIKNAMGVGIPGTGMIGLPIAVALGALVGKSEYSLEVLRDVTPEAVEEGKRYIAEGRISISLETDAPSNLHIDVRAQGDDHSVRVIISGAHTNFILIEKDGEVLFEKSVESGGSDTASSADPELNMQMVYDFATTAPLDEISFILEAKNLNLAAAQFALKGEYGHCLGSTVLHFGEKFFGDTPVAHAITLTSAACDARMGGAMVPVMSNSGSGNQGITATMPVVSYAMDIKASEEQMVRALVLSHLTSIYIKQSLGRLSALCGCVVASTGATSGLVYLMGGGYDQVCDAVKNMVANLTGMICDGAKPSCSMKISSGVSTAMMSAMLAMQGFAVTSAEGIISDDVDETIHNLTSIGRDSMQATDKLVLKIMTCK
ncbi:MAG: L-serine ammonia-lyase, iron-sulfur-dependent, subunit alpha [Muribaculaceae bacterium]|nr:L-serine ammonia-lyase, iron-sulfur-dependent, subunit alpha [Muribaculaceae bacterium]